MASARSTGGTLSLNGVPTELNEPKASLATACFSYRKTASPKVSSGILTCGKTSSSVTIQRPTRPPSNCFRNHKSLFMAPRRSGADSSSRGACAFDAMRAALGIKCSGPSSTISQLSGGNQQKALFARGACRIPT